MTEVSVTRCSSGVGSLGPAAWIALTLLAMPASLARAQCEEDADCGPGRVCEADELPVADCPPGQTCPAPAPDPDLERRCVGAPCREDADCPSGFGCDLRPSLQVSPACPPDDLCPEPSPDPESAPEPAPGPAPEPDGRCEPQPIECEVDADCPTGLTCVEEDRGDSAGVCESSPDGTETCEEVPEPEPATHACGYVLQPCEQDSDCTQAGYACITSQGVSHCSDAPCSADGECPDEPTCTVDEVQLCFPARVDCTSDSDCADGWTCFTLTEENTRNPPPSYEGATDVCFPEGIVLAIEERIELADVDDGGDGSRNASDSAEASGGVEVDDTANPTASDGDDKSAAEGSADSGCSVTESPMRGVTSTPLWLALASAVALARRRRSRAA
jgi:MYXO-CTERM domain-containing protein